MAKIIEIAGPAGAGKSTILKGLTQSWKENTNWIVNERLFPHQKLEPLKISSIAQNLPYLIKNGKTNLDNRALYEAGKRFILQNSAYIDAYWQNLHTNYNRDLEGFDNRFDSVAKFYSKIQKYQYIKEHSTNKYVLFDEGLLHDLAGRVPVKNKILQDDNNDIEQLIQVMPLPSMLIYIDTDVDTLLERITNRKKVINVHRKKTDDEIRSFTNKVKARMAFAKDLLQEKGVPVLSIDAKEAVSNNIKIITQYISQLKEMQPA